jgi:Kef-type K+ transport system membrane component KefB
MSPSLSHHDIVNLLLALAVLLFAARVGGEIARRLGQSSVIGEILAGVVLGKTIFGRLAPGAYEALFPGEGPVTVALQGLVVLAVVLFLMVAGMEVDLSTIWRRGKAALLISIGGMVVPFAIGFGPAYVFPGAMGMGDDGKRLVFALFVATAMSITALPVIAKVLLDLQLFRTDIGMTIIAAAVINDIVGWLIFAAVLAMMETAVGGETVGMPLWMVITLTLVFAGFVLTIGRWFVNRSLPWVQAHTAWPGGVIGFAIVLTLLSACFTEWIGVHGILGAFLFGVALGDSPHLRERTRGTIDHFVSFIFAPLFFATIGLRVDFVANFDLLLVVVVFAIAVVGKVFGCAAFARISGFDARESWAIGFGMNARGAMEIILGLLALQAGIIGEPLFVALVVMAIGTSIMSGTTMQAVLSDRAPLRFTDFASAKTFIARATPGDRREVIAEMSARLGETSGTDAKAIEEAVWRREQILPSGIGDGVAIPHARIVGLAQPVVSIMTLRHPVDFDARDGVPARVVVLILTSPEDAKAHLDLLASVVRTLIHEKRLGRAAEAESWTQFLAVTRADPD